MTTVYLVSSGEYSDYSVGPVFSTEALAQEYIDKWAKFGQNDYGIEERELDPEHEMNIPLQKGWFYFHVQMFKNGNSTSKKMTPYGQYREDDNERITLNNHYIMDKGYTKEVSLYGGVWAPDENGAAKIVNEKRTQLIASGEWDKEQKRIDKLKKHL